MHLLNYFFENSSLFKHQTDAHTVSCYTHDFFSTCISYRFCFRYFQCRQNHGLFLPLAKLTKIQVSTMAKDRTNSGNVHVHDSSPGNTAQPFPVESKRKAPDSFASGLTQSHYGSSDILSQVCLPIKAKNT